MVLWELRWYILISWIIKDVSLREKSLQQLVQTSKALANTVRLSLHSLKFFSRCRHQSIASQFFSESISTNQGSCAFLYSWMKFGWKHPITILSIDNYATVKLKQQQQQNLSGNLQLWSSFCVLNTTWKTLQFKVLLCVFRSDMNVRLQMSLYNKEDVRFLAVVCMLKALLYTFSKS